MDCSVGSKASLGGAQLADGGDQRQGSALLQEDVGGP